MKALVTCLAAIALCAVAAENKKPDFSGDWKLNVARSEAAGIPDDLVFKIRHADPEFLATQETGGEATVFKMGTDGKEYKNAIANGAEMVTVMKWDGDVLLSDSRIEIPNGIVKFADKIRLDGKTLRIERKISGPDGDGNLLLVMEK